MRGRGFTIRRSSAASNGCGGAGVSAPIATVTGGGSLLGGPVALIGPISSLLGRSDLFRSRPQNTRRPRSLHVDDFNKLEKDEIGGSEVRDCYWRVRCAVFNSNPP